MKRTLFKCPFYTLLASSLMLSAFFISGMVNASSEVRLTQGPPDNMGPFPIGTDTLGEFNLHRSIRDPFIWPRDGGNGKSNVLTLSSDNDYLVRTFKKSVEYTYNELVVGPRQFPLNESAESRIDRHYSGTGRFTSTAVPGIWGTYHGRPGGGYRECFCARDVSHTAEACVIMSLGEEQWSMFQRFANESADVYWRETDHDTQSPWRFKDNEGRYFPLWSIDNYGDAYYMDASFHEMPAPFEIMDKMWTQYRWTGDLRWISDDILNYAFQLHSYDKFMKYADYDGDGLADGGYFGVLPTLYEYEASGLLQTGDVVWNDGKIDVKNTGANAAEYPYTAEIGINTNFFKGHDFYELPLRMKLIGKDGKDDAINGEADFIVRVRGKTVDANKPAVLKNYERLNSTGAESAESSRLHDVEIPLNVPAGISFKVYDSIRELARGIDYKVVNESGATPVVVINSGYFLNKYIKGDEILDSEGNKLPAGSHRISVGIVTRFYQGGGEETFRDTTEVQLTDAILKDADSMNIIKVMKGDRDVTNRLVYDEDTNTTYLDYTTEELKGGTTYTFTVQYKHPVLPKKASSPNDLKSYFRVDSPLTRVVAAGDTIGCQYQALLGTAAMIRARMDMGMESFRPYHLEKGRKVYEGEARNLTEADARYYEKRAKDIYDVINRAGSWRPGGKWEYARAVNRLGEADQGWGHENSFFMPAKELLEPGASTQNYLNFIQMNGLLADVLNEEALTYMPEAFYMHGQNVTGWQWTKNSMNRLDEKQRNPAEIMGTYPEIAMINIFNTVNLVMGVEPGARRDVVSTLPRLTPEVGWVQVENIPLTQSGRLPGSFEMPDGKGGVYYGMDSDGYPRAVSYGRPNVGTLYTVRHQGTWATTFTNQGSAATTAGGDGTSGESIQWRARFYSVNNQNEEEADGYRVLYISKDGGATSEEIAPSGHTDYPPYTTYLDVEVKPGETISVSTRKRADKPAPNDKGELYLSDFDWIYSSCFEREDNGSLIGAPRKDMGYKGTTLYSPDFLRSYAKGIGTRAARDGMNTTIRYLIPGAATEFRAMAILTDFYRQTGFEVSGPRTRAAVKFEVFVDGVKQGRTVTVGDPGGRECNESSAALQPREIRVPFAFESEEIDEIHTLDLVTSWAGGEDRNEGAAWADARISVTGVNELPRAIGERSMYLSDLAADSITGRVVMDAAASSVGKPLILGGAAHQKGVSMQGKSSASFDLGGIYSTLKLIVGKQDESQNITNGELQIFLDGRQTSSCSLNNSDKTDARTIDLKKGDGTCADSIKLVYTGDQGCVNFADGILTLDKDVDLADPGVIAAKILAASDASLGERQYVMPGLPVKESLRAGYNFTIKSATEKDSAGISRPSRVLLSSGEIKADAVGHIVDVIFTVAARDRDKWPKAADTRSFSIYVPPATEIPLERVSWLTAGDSITRDAEEKDSCKSRVDGVFYVTGVGIQGNNCESVTYDLGKTGNRNRYNRFTGTVGYDQKTDSSNSNLVRVKLEGVKTVDGKEVTELLHVTPVLGKSHQNGNRHITGCAECRTAIMDYGYATSDRVDVDLYDYDKLVVTRMNAGTIASHGLGPVAIVNAFFHGDSPYKGKTIIAMDEIAVDTVSGKKPALPAQVTVTYDGVVDALKKRKVPVTWAPMDSGKYATIGSKFDVNGTVRDAPLKAVCRVTVKDKVPVTLEGTAVITAVYSPTAGTMPSTVKATFTDKSIGSETVNWENVPDQWTSPGTHTVYGSIDNSSLKAICVVSVHDPNELKMATKSPISHSADNGWGLNETYKLMGNGLEYPNSIFAHANSTIIYDLASMGGGFTRFITDVGSKAEGGNTSFVVTGYGIKGGQETQLFKTDMVTGLSNSLGDGKGYCYVGRDTVFGIDVDIRGYDKLKLVADTAGTADSDHCVYGTPRLYTADSRVGRNLLAVSVSASEGGAIWPNGKVAVQKGGNLIFTIKPNPANLDKPDVRQMEIKAVKVNGRLLSVRNDLKKNADGTYTCTIKNVTNDMTVDVSFCNGESQM